MNKAWLPVSLLVLLVGYGCGGDEGGGTASGGASAGGSSGSSAAGTAGTSAAGSNSGGSTAGGSGGMASGGSSVGGTSVGGGGGNPGDCFDTSSPYPAGPYGTAKGDIVANMDLEGYVNLEADAISNTKPYVDTSLEALRRTGHCYAMVHVSEFF